MEKFPKRVFTENEVKQARDLIERGYKHKLTTKGSEDFKKKVQEALGLVKTAGDYDFLRTYIREIVEIEGLSQLHESDAAIWANMPMLADPVDAASYIVQKAWQMKDYIEGRLYYGTSEMGLVEKRQEFLGKLRQNTRDSEIQKKCDELLKRWAESGMTFP